MATYSSREVQKKLKIPPWALDNLVRHGFVPAPAKKGRDRVWTEADIQRIREVLAERARNRQVLAERARKATGRPLSWNGMLPA
jgi:DNA-binding transcriptional MerR regulator